MSDQPVEPTADSGAVLEEIPRDECLRLLGSQVIGRLAVADFNSAPLVVPVNFVLDGESVVFRSDYGTKFRLGVLGEKPVSFQVDSLDPGRPSGWSVLVQGNTEEIDEWQASRLKLKSWAGGAKWHWVRIVADSITGRRIRLPAPLPPEEGG